MPAGDQGEAVRRAGQQIVNQGTETLKTLVEAGSVPVATTARSRSIAQMS